MRLLGVAAQKRLPNLPNLPALNETVPGVVSSGWIVLMAPAGVPDAIIQKINADLRKVVAMPDVVERFHTLGTYTRDFTPAQTDEFMRSEEKLWWPIVRQVNKEQAKVIRAPRAENRDISRPARKRRAVSLWDRRRRGAARRTSPTAPNI